MAYNTKHIQNFIDKVKKEAEEKAQEVFNRYNDELIQRIQNQMHEGDVINIGMGTASIIDKFGKDKAEKMADIISSTQYWNESVSAGFDLPNKLTK